MSGGRVLVFLPAAGGALGELAGHEVELAAGAGKMRSPSWKLKPPLTQRSKRSPDGAAEAGQESRLWSAHPASQVAGRPTRIRLPTGADPCPEQPLAASRWRTDRVLPEPERSRAPYRG
jgi:hypothetical protein